MTSGKLFVAVRTILLDPSSPALWHNVRRGSLGGHKKGVKWLPSAPQQPAFRGRVSQDLEVPWSTDKPNLQAMQWKMGRLSSPSQSCPLSRMVLAFYRAPAALPFRTDLASYPSLGKVGLGRASGRDRVSHLHIHQPQDSHCPSDSRKGLSLKGQGECLCWDNILMPLGHSQSYFCNSHPPPRTQPSACVCRLPCDASRSQQRSADCAPGNTSTSPKVTRGTPRLGGPPTADSLWAQHWPSAPAAASHVLWSPTWAVAETCL